MQTAEELLERQQAGSVRTDTVRLVLAFTLRVLLWGYVAFILGKHGIYRPLTQTGVDYPKHWLAARAILDGENNYTGNYWLWLGFNYPQWSALISFWIACFDIGTAEIVWKMIGLGLIVACWWIAWRCFRPEAAAEGEAPLQIGETRRSAAEAMRRDWPLTCAVMVALFAPAGASSLFLGQIEPMNAFLVMAFVGALLIEKEGLAGVYWAMLCLIKMIPVFLIVPIILWRRWRILKTWAIFMAVYAIVLVVTGRLQYEWFFVTEAAGKIPFRWRGISVALPRAIMLLFFPGEWRDDELHYMRFMNTGMVILCGLYVAAIAAIRRGGWSFLRSLEVAIMFIPLLSPLLENHHFAWTLPVFFLQVRRWIRGEMTAGVAFVLVLGWWLIALDYFCYNLMAHMGDWPRFISMPGAIIIIIACMIEFARAKSARPLQAAVATP